MEYSSFVYLLYNKYYSNTPSEQTWYSFDFQFGWIKKKIKYTLKKQNFLFCLKSKVYIDIPYIFF